MIKFAGHYIPEDNIEAVNLYDSDDVNYPYALSVYTKHGIKIGQNYKYRPERNEDARKIITDYDAARERAMPPTDDMISSKVRSEIDKIRPYLRRIERALRKKETE